MIQRVAYPKKKVMDQEKYTYLYAFFLFCLEETKAPYLI